MDQLMRVPLPLKLHQQKARMIHFLWRVPLILMGLLGEREEKFNFLAKGLFACFNMLRKDARDREADRRWLAQELHRHEKNQKDMAPSLNLPHSPAHEMRTFDPPSPVPNPWEDLGSWDPVDDEEEDYEGEEEYDEDDEE
jgi:hypothetical protein